MRINQLSLALLHLFGRPLPEVFRDAIMRPIGASDTWRWVGYDNAWIDLNGCRVQSVPGGTHWGHLRQDKHGFPLIIYHYAAIGSLSCWFASQR